MSTARRFLCVEEGIPAEECMDPLHKVKTVLTVDSAGALPDTYVLAPTARVRPRAGIVPRAADPCGCSKFLGAHQRQARCDPYLPVRWVR